MERGRKRDAEAAVDFAALLHCVLKNGLDELRTALVVELSTADHDRTDAVVVQPLHIVVYMSLL